MLWVLAEAFVAFDLGWFWPSRVMAKWGKPGIGFFSHGGMWGDLFLLPPTFAWVIATYSHTWSTKQIVIMAVVGVGVTLANHLLLIFTQKVPDPLGWKGEKWSALIAMHFVYMSTYVALATGFFCFSHGVSIDAAAMVSVVLGIHTALGKHVVLGVLNRWHQWPWCPDFLSRPSISLEITGGVWIILAGFSLFTTGPMAFFLVAGIGIGFFAFVDLIKGLFVG